MPLPSESILYVTYPGTSHSVTLKLTIAVCNSSYYSAELTLAGLGIVGATIDFDIDVCLCLDANVPVRKLMYSFHLPRSHDNVS